MSNRFHASATGSNTSYTVFLTEDTLLSIGAWVSQGGTSLSHDPHLLLEKGLFLLSEGMSEQPGEEHLIPDALSTTFLEHERQGRSKSKTLATLVTEAHERIVQQRAPQSPWIGTGFLAASFENTDLFFTGIGDVRLYLYTPSSLQQLTDDDTRAWQRYCSGEITKEEARISTEADIFTRVLGSDESSRGTLLDKNYTLALGDVYLLCNRAFWGVLSDARIHQLITTGYKVYPDNDFAVAQMLVAAAASVKKDATITVALARVKEIPLSILVERGLATIEAENLAVLSYLMEKDGGKAKELMRRSKDGRAHFVYTTYRRYFEEKGIITSSIAAGYEQVLRSPIDTPSDKYITASIHALFQFYSETYLLGAKKEHASFIKNLLALRERARGHEEKIDAALCECVESIGDAQEKALLFDAHRVLSPLFSEVPQLENSIMHVHIQLSERALAAGNIVEAHELLHHVSMTPYSYDTFKTRLSARRERLYLGIANAYATSRDITSLVALYAEGEDLSSLSDHRKDTAHKLYKVGRRALQTGDAINAQRALTEVLFIEPKHIDTLVSLAELSINEQRYQDALPLLENALHEINVQQKVERWKPGTYQKSSVYILLAKVHYHEAKKDPASASETAQKLLRAKQCAPHNTEISTFIEETKERFEKEGRAHFDTNAYAAALLYLQAAQTLGASNDWTTWRIGRCYEAARDYAAARTAYERLPYFKNAQIGLRRLTRYASAK